MRGDDRWIDDLEAELGRDARLRLLAQAGGQRRTVPQPASAGTSRLAAEVGADVAAWLAERFGSGYIDVPSATARAVEDRSNRLRAAILEAGLGTPTRSANDIAVEFGVTSIWVRKLRAKMRAGT